MRLLLINPNTTQSITDLVAARSRAILGPDHEVQAVTGRFGEPYISTREAVAVAGHAALDALRSHREECDAFLLACFGDPGLLALKESSPVPVVGMAEASCHLACLLGRRFSIVTGGERWGPMLREFVGTIGLSERLASVRTVAPTGGEIAADPDRALATLASACQECATHDSADIVILGGAGLAGLAEVVTSRAEVPVICSLDAGLRATVAAAELAHGRSRPGGRLVEADSRA